MDGRSKTQALRRWLLVIGQECGGGAASPGLSQGEKPRRLEAREQRSLQLQSSAGSTLFASLQFQCPKVVLAKTSGKWEPALSLLHRIISPTVHVFLSFPKFY